MSNILIIEDDATLISEYNVVLNSNLGIKHNTINSFETLIDEIQSNQYSHIVSKYAIKNQSIVDFQNILNIPTLIIAEEAIPTTLFSFSKSPLTYSKLFSFICETSTFSYNTLSKYVMGEAEILAELKKNMLEEFEDNFNKLPYLIDEKNLEVIKSKVHQMSTKFSLLEMEKSFLLSKEIDMNMLIDSENQLVNTQDLLIDIEIVIEQLKN